MGANRVGFDELGKRQIVDSGPATEVTPIGGVSLCSSRHQPMRLGARGLTEGAYAANGMADPVKCKVMAALGTEAEDMVKDAADDSVRDAALISAGQRVEHYEIACYGAVRRWAELLGEKTHAELLDKTIQEEGHADKLLTEIAERVNPYAEKAA